MSLPIALARLHELINVRSGSAVPTVLGSRFVHLCSQVATAIRGAIIQAKMSVVPIRRGYWGNKIGKVRSWRCCGACEQALLIW